MRYTTRNKKGVVRLFSMLMVVGFVGFAAIFGFLFIQNLYSQELIPKVQTQALENLGNNGNNSDIYTLINEQDDNYNNLDFNVDLIFFAFWVSTNILAGFLAYKMPRMNTIKFLAFLFIGVIILLLGYNFIEQILSWLVSAFINGVFSTDQTYLPIFNFFVDNFIFINVLSMGMVLLINQFSPRGEEELEFEDGSSFDSEDTDFSNDNFAEDDVDLSGGKNNEIN